MKKGWEKINIEKNIPPKNFNNDYSSLNYQIIFDCMNI